MGLLDFFKKKTTTHPPPFRPSQPTLRMKKKKKKERILKKEKKIVGKKEEVKPKVFKPKKRISGEGYGILDSPHVTEKATALAQGNKYVFKVGSKANKNEIKKAIESVYGVDVTGVKIINIVPKKRRLGRQTGWKKGYKKAIVEIRKDQKIEILPR